MSQSSETKTANSNKVIIAIAAAVIVIALCITAVFIFRKDDESDSPKIGYATEATVMLDQDSLQAAVDEALENAKNGMVALQYQNEAFSTDGKTFTCHIVNDPGNIYDMFLTIFADEQLTDQVYLSGLVPPGSGFEEITLDRALDVGDHTVYVAVTQVDTDENGEQVIRNQVMHTILFHVLET